MWGGAISAKQRALRLVVALGVLGGAVLVAAAPAPATPQHAALPESTPPPPAPYFTDLTGAQVSVKGSYTPIVGRFTRLDLDDIIWYAPAWLGSSGIDRRWTPCVGCPGGPFTKSDLAHQIHGDYEPVVGDFAGDGHDDIIWIGYNAGSFLWTNDGDGGFISSALNTSGASTEDLAATLPDSRLGSGKDDLIWSRADHSPWNSVMWIFPDDGSGIPLRKEIPEINGLIVGDFDGNGASDLMDAPWAALCDDNPYDGDCPATEYGTPLTYRRRATGESTTFTEAKQRINNNYWPVVGRFEGTGDPTDDIVWVGGWGTIDRSRTWPPYNWYDGPDGLWTGTPSGHFAKTTTSIRVISETVLLTRDSGDTILFPTIGRLWYLRSAGPILRSVPAIEAPSGFTGRFFTPDRDDYFAYRPGTAVDHLYHPTK